MDFAADEITERFVRGDAGARLQRQRPGSRHRKKYTEACGGTFDVSVDGDQFKGAYRLSGVRYDCKVNSSEMEILSCNLDYNRYNRN